MYVAKLRPVRKPRPQQAWQLRLRKSSVFVGETEWETKWFDTEAHALRWLRENEPERGKQDYILYRVVVRGPHDYLFATRSRGVKHGA